MAASTTTAAAADRAKDVIKAEFRMFSGCEDAQTSADVADIATFKLPDPAGRGGGACTSGLLQVLYADHVDQSADLSFEEVCYRLRDNLDQMGLSQIPQLSSSRQMDMKQMFDIVPDGCTGTRRAVMIGINYKGQDGELSGCQNDVKNMKEYLQEVHGFQEENITLLLDDKKHYKNQKHLKPKRTNITKALKKLVKESEPGDVCFIHFSGHGGKIKDFDGDEDDGFDETLVPVDFEKAGQIRDDYLYKNVVCPMKEGVTVTCVFDCCHSGTVLDLPFVFKGDGSQEEMKSEENYDFDKIENMMANQEESESDDDDDDDSSESEDDDDDDDNNNNNEEEEKAEELVEEEEVEEEEEEEAEPSVTSTEQATSPASAQTQSTTEFPPEPEPAPSGDVKEVHVRYRQRSLVISADVDDKILEIKKELEEQTGIPVSEQKLVYTGLGTQFSDHKSLSYYGCQSGGFFNLEQKKASK